MFSEDEIVGFKKFKESDVALARIVSEDENVIVVSVLTQDKYSDMTWKEEIITIGEKVHERVFKIHQTVIDSLVGKAISEIEETTDVSKKSDYVNMVGNVVDDSRLPNLLIAVEAEIDETIEKLTNAKTIIADAKKAKVK